MSVQLILYPQIYKGISNIIYSGVQSEFIIDGNTFNSINTLPSGQKDENLSFGNIINFNPIGSLQACAINPPLIPQVWYNFRFGEISSGTYTDYASESGGNLVMPTFYSNPQSLQQNRRHNKVYQLMQNLIIGETYTVTIGTTSVASQQHAVRIDILNLNQGGTTVNSPSGQTWIQYSNNSTISNDLFITLDAPEITVTFVAQETSQIIFVSCLSFEPNQSAQSNIVLTKISVRNNVTATQTTTDPLLANLNGQVICDTYEDEAVPLTISVDDFKNVAEKVQSYSKAFKLPGTKRNNQIFENIFDVTRTSQGNTSFNPYGKTKAELKQDGLLLFEGYMRLIDIQEKEGELSYNINLYSEVVAFADIISDGTFADLDFSELLHDYDKDSIKNSWDDTVGLPLTNPLTTSSPAYDAALGLDNTNVLKYPFIDWTHQMLIANGSTGSSATANRPELTLLEQAFRPCVQVKYLIDKIFEQTAFNYTSNFFETTEFKKLFMDFNWGEEPSGSAPQRQDETKRESSGTQWMTQQWQRIDLLTAVSGNQTLWDGNDRFMSDVSNLEVSGWARLRLENATLLTPRTCHMRLVVRNAADVVLEEIERVDTTLAPGSSLPYLNVSFSTVLNLGDYICLEGYQDSGLSNQVRVNTGTMKSYLEINYNNNAVSTTSLLNLARAEVGQWDFFKGIMNMFNLVTIPDKSDANNILIEPYDDIFGIDNADIKKLDWTNKVDVSEMKLTPLIELNSITKFRFAEDEDDYIFQLYKSSVVATNTGAGHLYGSLTVDARTAASGLVTLLTGEKEILAEPFAATISKRLMPQYTQMIVPAIYAADTDTGESKGFHNSPRILYNNGVIDTTISYYIPEQNGKSGENQPELLQFSHLTDIPTVTSTPPVSTDTNDFHFGACQLMNGVGQPTANNLYSRFWQPYFGELYNPDTRIMTLKVNLTPADLNTLNLFDRIYIKNREFRINKIDYKPNSLATVEFILIP